MMSPMKIFLIISIITAISAIYITDASKNWPYILDISNKILDEYNSTDLPSLFRDLSLLKHAINSELTRRIPLNYRYTRKFSISAALSLLRITTISYDKCSESNMLIERGSAHRNNYIALVPIVMQFFPSERIANIVRRYHKSQLVICKNALYLQLRQKIDHQLATSPAKLQNKFIHELTSSLSHSIERNLSGKSAVHLGIAQYFRNKLTKWTDIEAAKSDLAMFSLFHSKLIADCNTYLLNPYKTLVLTYDTLGRSTMPNIKETYNQLIVAYDFCREIERSTSNFDMNDIMANLRDLTTSNWTNKSTQPANISPPRTIIPTITPEITQPETSSQSLINKPKVVVGSQSSAFRKYNAQPKPSLPNIITQAPNQQTSGYFTSMLVNQDPNYDDDDDEHDEDEV